MVSTSSSSIPNKLMLCISAMHPVIFLLQRIGVHGLAGHAFRQKQKALRFHGVVVSVQHASHRIRDSENYTKRFKKILNPNIFYLLNLTK